ncbi:MAG: hypothetical protein CMD06_07750 [Flavobacteriales bacterium]|nr:hypothetical protein [Flavobacteriales bacterium]|tara:strand:+ start:164 stop:820 length:657 start_codon:yes stop_codon:yes gene_type:complete
MKYLISQSVKVNDDGMKYSYLDEEYIRYFNRIGIKLIPVDNLKNEIDDYFTDDICGVILSGSGDIKKIVNSNIPEKNPVFFHERDRAENKLIEYTISNNLPLIGICHGMQKINDFFGGEIQPYHHCKKETFSEQGIFHDIRGLDDLIGKNIRYSINQYHDHCILEDDLAKNLKCFAVDVRFNTVEGFYNNKNKILGIQWHPERKINNDIAKDIIHKFI